MSRKRNIIIGSSAVILIALISGTPKKPDTVTPDTPTPAPTQVNRWSCPHPSQIQLTPMGQKDPVCVYRMGTIGSQIRSDYNDLFAGMRRDLTNQGLTLQDTEIALYKLDLNILQEAIDRGETIPGN